MVADGIALLPNWSSSQGARTERSMASMLGIPSHPLESWLSTPQKKPKRWIVGFTGYKGSGKDTAAAFLREIAQEQGMTTDRRGFADALKDELASRICNVNYARVRAEMDDPTKKERYRLGLQWWGSEFRRTDDPDYWIKKMRTWLEQCTADLVVIPDVRFENEAALIRELGGIIVRVTRPNNAPNDSHISETGIEAIAPDTNLDNSEGKDSLRLQVKHRFWSWRPDLAKDID